jgi:hypothetical protein
VERGLEGKVKISPRHANAVLVILWAAFIAWLFQQDNGAGRIVGIEGLRFFFTKILFVSAFFFVAGIIISMVLHDPRVRD